MQSPFLWQSTDVMCTIVQEDDLRNKRERTVAEGRSTGRALLARQGGDVESGADLMGRVGRRLRAARAARGMTRRALAQDAEVSERYLAEIENGKANLSLQVLCRAAAAMGVEPLTLLREEEEPLHPALHSFLANLSAEQQVDALEMLRKHFIAEAEPTVGVALIGLRGAGKSTLGALLAERQGCPFVCLTDLIQQRGGMGVEEIFSLGGQQLYRRLEREALEQVISRSGPLVLETGGSLVSEAGTFARLLERFYTVWVEASPEEHMSRVIAQGDLRPMHGNEEAMEDLRRILAARGPLYRSAHARLDTSGKTLVESLDRLTTITQGVLTTLRSDDKEASPRAKHA